MVEAQVSYAVVGHYTRRNLAEGLAGSLNAFLAMDEGDKGSLLNHDLAWRMAAENGSDWVVVLEDDVELVPDFERHVQNALRNVPGEGAISFYTGTGRPRERQVTWALRRAQQTGASWLVSQSAYWGPALVLPTGRVNEMLDVVSLNKRPYDQRFSTYLSKSRLPCYYTIPCLVDHLDGESLLSDTSVSRKARIFAEPDEWNQRAVKFI